MTSSSNDPLSKRMDDDELSHLLNLTKPPLPDTVPPDFHDQLMERMALRDSQSRRGSRRIEWIVEKLRDLFSLNMVVPALVAACLVLAVTWPMRGANSTRLLALQEQEQQARIALMNQQLEMEREARQAAERRAVTASKFQQETTNKLIAMVQASQTAPVVAPVRLETPDAQKKPTALNVEPPPVAAPQQPVQQSNSSHQTFIQALIYHIKGEFDQALPLYQHVASDPDNFYAEEAVFLLPFIYVQEYRKSQDPQDRREAVKAVESSTQLAIEKGGKNLLGERVAAFKEALEPMSPSACGPATNDLTPIADDPGLKRVLDNAEKESLTLPGSFLHRQL